MFADGRSAHMVELCLCLYITDMNLAFAAGSADEILPNGTQMPHLPWSQLQFRSPRLLQAVFMGHATESSTDCGLVRNWLKCRCISIGRAPFTAIEKATPSSSFEKCGAMGSMKHTHKSKVPNSDENRSETAAGNNQFRYGNFVLSSQVFWKKMLTR